MMNDTKTPATANDDLHFIGLATAAVWAAEEALRAAGFVAADGETVVEMTRETRLLFDALYRAEWRLREYRREYMCNLAKAKRLAAR